MATFNQQDQTVGQQANFETNYGGVNFGPSTPSSDMRKVIQAIKAQLDGIKGLPSEVKAQLNDALDGAASVEPSPQHADVKGKLDEAGTALETVAKQVKGADDLAQKALSLAKTIFSIGKWVIAAVAI